MEYATEAETRNGRNSRDPNPTAPRLSIPIAAPLTMARGRARVGRHWRASDLADRDRATLFRRGWQMGLDLTTRIEKLLTWLGLWGAMRGFFPLAAAIALSVALLESLTSPVARLFPSVPVNLIHVFSVGTGILLGTDRVFRRRLVGSPLRDAVRPQGEMVRGGCPALPRASFRGGTGAPPDPRRPGASSETGCRRGGLSGGGQGRAAPGGAVGADRAPAAPFPIPAGPSLAERVRGNPGRIRRGPPSAPWRGARRPRVSWRRPASAWRWPRYSSFPIAPCASST